MIERHYFQGKLIKSYDFNFDFCIPNSTNEWESIYDMPPLSAKEVQAFVDAKGDKRQASDSFYFVDGEMVMHNKAFYTYFDEEVEGKTEKKQ